MWCTELQTGSEAPITKAFLYEARFRFFAEASLGMLVSAFLGVAASTRYSTRFTGPGFVRCCECRCGPLE